MELTDTWNINRYICKVLHKARIITLTCLLSNTVRYKNTPIHHLITYFYSFVPCTAMFCIITLKNPALMWFSHITCFRILLHWIFFIWQHFSLTFLKLSSDITLICIRPPASLYQSNGREGGSKTMQISKSNICWILFDTWTCIFGGKNQFVYIFHVTSESGLL